MFCLFAPFLLFFLFVYAGCASNFGLFDQVTAGGRRRRRRLQEGTDGEIALDFLTVTGSCFCPPGAVEATPSEEVISTAFEESVEELKEEGTITFVEEVEALEEVSI